MDFWWTNDLGFQKKKRQPTRNDFDPSGGDLDAIDAWKNFGGLNVDEAYERFCEAPEVYQDDFQWMGPKAFAFYFPVLDRYLRDTSNSPEADGCAIGSIALTLLAQFGSPNNRESHSLKSQALDLARFVIQNVEHYATEANDQTETLDHWTKLSKLLVCQIDGR